MQCDELESPILRRVGLFVDSSRQEVGEYILCIQRGGQSYPASKEVLRTTFKGAMKICLEVNQTRKKGQRLRVVPLAEIDCSRAFVSRTVADLRNLAGHAEGLGEGHYLSLGKQCMIDEDMPAVIDLIMVEPQWTSLGLTDNEITDAGLTYIADALAVGKIQLQGLYVSSNNLTFTGMNAMSRIMTAQGGNIKTVGLNYHVGIGCCGAERLASALQRSCLSVLGLTHCSIRSPGCVALARALERHPTMTRLYLNGNLICDEGALHMAAMLTGNRCLLRLGLGYNHISDVGSEALRAALIVNDVFERLCMFGNSLITAAEFQELRKMPTVNLVMP